MFASFMFCSKSNFVTRATTVVTTVWLRCSRTWSSMLLEERRDCERERDELDDLDAGSNSYEI